MSRKEDFEKAAEDYCEDHSHCIYFEAGAEYGYQYAVEHSDDIIRLIIRMAKKDIAFTEEEAVKFYHEEMEE